MRTSPGGGGSTAAQLPHTAQEEPVSAPANHATRLRGLSRPRRRRAGFARPRLNGCASQYESNQEVLGGRGVALGQATGHWGGQIAHPSSWFPTPIRVSRPNTAHRTRKGTVKRWGPLREARATGAPPRARRLAAAPGGERRPVITTCSQRWTGRRTWPGAPPSDHDALTALDWPLCLGTRSARHGRALTASGPLGVSARSAASRSGTS